MDKYKSIRPYNDDEVSDVLSELLQDKVFLSTLLNMRFSKLYKIVPSFLEKVAKIWLRSKTKNIKSIDNFQFALRPYAEKLMTATTDDLTISGLDQLENNLGYLYISNHRDIAMDSTCLSFLLHKNEYITPRNAIGSNLMQKEFVGKLLRLNKSFIVKRDITKPRQLFAALLQLSSYMRFSIKTERHSVWLAQREGRAKDGWDKTDETIIKMLMMSSGKQMEFKPALDELNIVPVSVSYEYDPCELMKAKELIEVARTGDYVKEENEDADSIFMGIKGYKGRVHISLGKPLNECVDIEDTQKVTEELDRQIVNNYVLFPNNFFAYEELEQSGVEGLCLPTNEPFIASDFEAERKVFLKRLNGYTEEQKQQVLNAYANPIKHKIHLGLM